MSESEINSYEKLVEQLELQYGDKHLQQVYQAQLKGKQQKFEESLQQFGTEILTLVRMAYLSAPDDFLNHLAVQTLIDGIRDVDTQMALRLANPSKTPDAIARVLKFEAAK